MKIADLPVLAKTLLKIALILFLGGCSWKPVQETSRPARSPPGVEVYLLPLDDFDSQAVASIAQSLSKEMDIRIKTAASVRTAGLIPFSGTTQFSAEEIETHVLRVIPTLPDKRSNTAYIVLTTKDINTKDRTLQFNFSIHDNLARLAIVSSARLTLGPKGAPASRSTVLARLKKLVKRGIGDVYYNYPRSTDVRDIMYSPVMSLDDLDRIGNTFKAAKQR